jgi:lipopolysaccharide export system protein LptA
MGLSRSLRLAVATVVAGACLTGAPGAAPDAQAEGAFFTVGGDTIGVEAEHLEIDVDQGQATLTGAVVLTKGDLKVSCPKIELKFDATPHVLWVRGSGGVVAALRGVHAEAPEVEMDFSKRILELRGGVRLTRGAGWIAADRASIETATAKVTLSGVKGSIPVPPRAP